MRFLTDAGISPVTVDFLQHLGHDVLHVRTPGMHRSSDQTILARVTTDARILITFDLDFGDILALGIPERPSVVILRAAEPPDRLGLDAIFVQQEAGNSDTSNPWWRSIGRGSHPAWR